MQVHKKSETREADGRARKPRLPGKSLSRNSRGTEETSTGIT